MHILLVAMFSFPAEFCAVSLDAIFRCFNAELVFGHSKIEFPHFFSPFGTSFVFAAFIAAPVAHFHRECFRRTSVQHFFPSRVVSCARTAALAEPRRPISGRRKGERARCKRNVTVVIFNGVIDSNDANKDAYQFCQYLDLGDGVLLHDISVAFGLIKIVMEVDVESGSWLTRPSDTCGEAVLSLAFMRRPVQL